MTYRDELTAFLDGYLDIGKIADVSCNGLQVEGAESVERVGLAVDGCLETYRQAAERGCQMLIVHHGLIWGGLSSLRSATARQVRCLMEANTNLYAAHLPLDMHHDVGNNAQLAHKLGLGQLAPFGDYKGVLIGFEGRLSKPLSLDELIGRVMDGSDERTIALPFGAPEITRVGVVSGGGSDCIPEAVDKGLDCLITGEPQHWNHHAALEGGLNVAYCGHYHTETLGVKALGREVERRFDVATEFIDAPTIV